MTKDNKSYRSLSNVAPFRPPVTKITNRKVSWINKFKDILHNKKESLKRSVSQPVENKKSTKSSIIVPGGFFNGNNGNVSMTTSVNNSANNSINNINSTTNDIDGINTSNIQLANFFARKGNAALSEIEIEGVMSLMEKSRNGFSNSVNTSININNNTHNNINNHDNTNLEVFKNSRVLSNSSLVSNSSFKVPNFNPKFDDSNNHNFNNTSILSNNSTTRRIFDYSSAPTPYKAVIFKYQSNNRKKSNLKNTSLSSSSILKNNSHLKHNDSLASNIITKKTDKKMSNVASALVTLLNNKDNVENNSKINGLNKLSNPYGSYIRKPKKINSITPTDVTKNVDINNTEVKNKPEEISKIEKPLNMHTENNDSNKNLIESIENKFIHDETNSKFSEKNLRTDSASTFIFKQTNDSKDINNDDISKDDNTEEIKPKSLSFFQPLKSDTVDVTKKENEIGNKNFNNVPVDNNIETKDKAEKNLLSQFLSKQSDIKDSTTTDKIEDDTRILKKSKEVSKPNTIAKSPVDDRNSKDIMMNKQFDFNNQTKTNIEEENNPTSKMSVNEKYIFEFETPEPSNFNPQDIDQEKVNKYKTSFIF